MASRSAADRAKLVAAIVAALVVVVFVGAAHVGADGPPRKPDAVIEYYLYQQLGLNEFGTVPAAQPPANGTLTGVGLQVVYDYPATTRPPADSGALRVGAVRGTSTVVTNTAASTVFVVSNVVHYEGVNGTALRGTWSHHGEAAFSSGLPWELAIVGGTGAFRRARGFSVGRVVSITRASGAPVVVTGYNASIWL